MGHGRARTALWGRSDPGLSTEWETPLSSAALLIYPQGHPLRSQTAWCCLDLNATSTLASAPSVLTSDTERMFMWLDPHEELQGLYLW